MQQVDIFLVIYARGRGKIRKGKYKYIMICRGENRTKTEEVRDTTGHRLILQCLIAAQPDWSFPSGHASASFASAVVIYKSCPCGIGVPALVLAFAISLSRLSVGVHYPSDVIVGMVIGTLIALILFWIFGEKKYKARARRR